MELTVDAAERGKGHGSRLLQAAADTMVADRFTRAVTWLVADDDAQRTFLTEAGWAPDGAHRTLDLDGTGSHPGQAGPAAHRPGLTAPLVSGAGGGTMEPAAPAAPLRRNGGRTMFGPLPLLHRIVLALVTAASGVLAGAWARTSRRSPSPCRWARSSAACSASSRRTPWCTSRSRDRCASPAAADPARR